METEVVRLIADALAHADHGVGAVVAHVPRVSGDALPATPPIYDETRDDWVALEEVPSVLPAGVDFPCLAVTLGTASTRVDGRPQPSREHPAQGEFEAYVNVHYFTRDVDAAAARREARTVLRAVRGAITALWHPSRAADRQLNGVLLQTCISLEAVSQFQPLEDITIAGACAIHVRGREAYPTVTPAT